MAMPSGNVVISDKMQFPASNGGAAGGSGGNEIYHRQWFPDERDGFISWLRGEFAAANAIIDAFCHHFQVVGDPGEYDPVLRSIAQRRCNWTSILHMQQYYPIAEVIMALNQVVWRRQQRHYDPVKGGGKEFRRSGGGFKQGQRGDGVKEVRNSSIESHNQDGNLTLVAGSDKREGGHKKHEGIKANNDGIADDKGVAAIEEKLGNSSFLGMI